MYEGFAKNPKKKRNWAVRKKELAEEERLREDGV